MTNKQLSAKEMRRLKKMFARPGFTNRFKSVARFIMSQKKNFKYEVNLGGGSYTDGKKVVIGLPEHFFTESLEHQIMALKALNGHEIEHVVSSDFEVFKDFQEQVYQFFNAEYGLRNGRKLGAQLLNCTEDGRIEKRLVNRLKGMKKYIQFLNGTLWNISPVKGQNMLAEYTLNVCYMATSGVWMKDFDEVYGGTRMEEELMKVKPLILEAINEQTAQGCADVTMKIIKTNADFLAELLKPGQNAQNNSGDPTDQLKRAEAEYTTRPGHGDGEEIELSDSSHFVSEDEQDEKQDSQKQKAKKQAKKQDKDEQDEDNQDAAGGSSQNSQNDDESEENDDAEGQGGKKGEDTEDEDDSDTPGGSSDSEEGDDQEDSDAGADGQSESDGDGNQSSSDQSGEQSEGGSDDSESSQDNSEESTDNQSESGNQGPEADGSHPEDNMSVDEIIKNAVREADQQLEEETQKSIRQAVRENEQADKEAARKASERAKTQLDSKEIGAIMGRNAEINGLNIKYDLHEEVTDPIDEVVKRRGFKFRKDVEEIFLNKKGFTRKNRRGGMLDSNQLWRMSAGDTDVFVQKGRPKDSSYAVSVLVDNSGSMSEGVQDPSTMNYKTKAYYAKQACVMLEEGLKGKLPLQITQFDYWGYGRPLRHLIVRGFEDLDDTNHSWERINDQETGGGNADGYSIKVAHRELMKRPERQKVLFVLSDGEPSGYNSHEQGQDHVREAVEEARKDGVIVIAIRFGTQSFLNRSAEAYKKMYQHSYIACEPADIQKELVKLLKKTIK